MPRSRYKSVRVRRKCLACDKTFWSQSPANRICLLCSAKDRSSHRLPVAREVTRKPIPVHIDV